MAGAESVSGVFVVGPSTMGLMAENDDEQRATLENPATKLSDPNAFKDTIFQSLATDAGRTITVRDAIGYSPVWQAVSMISGDVAKLPLELFRRVGDTFEPDLRHPAYFLVRSKSNRELSALQFWRVMMAAALLWGDGWAWIERDALGRPTGLFPLLPDRTTIELINGRRFVVSEVAGRLEVFDPQDVFHLSGLCLDHQNPACRLVAAARHDIAVGLEARKFSSHFFRNKAQLGGVLQVPPGTSRRAKEKVESGIRDRHGDDAFRTLVLRDGFRWISTMAKPNEADVTAIDEAEVRHVARFFLLRPSRLGIDDSVSYNSLEADRRDYQDTTLSYWLSAIKAEADCKLLSDRDLRTRRRFFEYQTSALRWADVSTLANVGASLVQNGIISPRVVRQWFNVSEDDAGDRPASGGDLPAGGSEGGAGGSDQGDRAESPLRLAVRRCLVDALDRAATRLEIQAGKAERRGESPGGWKSIVDFHRPTCEEIAAPAIEAARAAGIITTETDPLEAIFEAAGKWPVTGPINLRGMIDEWADKHCAGD